MSDKTLCLLNQESKTIEKFLCEFFSWSKSFYKQQNFPSSWSTNLVQSKMELKIPIECLNHGRVFPAKNADFSKVKIIDENKWLVAINKSENIHTHPLNYLDENNVLSFLRAQGRNDLLEVNAKNYDRSLLYRLDFETSGLLLAAKNEEIYQLVRKNFQSTMKRKCYIAKCHGRLEKKSDLWIHYVKPKGVKGSVVACSKVPKDEWTKVILSWKLLTFDEKNNISEVEIELQTGFRHQIRTQFASEKHPLVGDILYGGNQASRLYLHALSYEVELFGQKFNFIAPLPENWN